MDIAFVKILNMSITASWLVLAVIFLRFILKKAPKWIRGILWGFVAIRLICPFSLESVFSLIPSTETIDMTVYSERPYIDTGVFVVDSSINNYLGDHYFEGVTVPANNASHILTYLCIIWIIGIIVMLFYTLVSYIRIFRKVREAVSVRENIWICDQISTPFIFGIVCPRIYLPSAMADIDKEYVILHEQAHLRRKDHIWKPIGFLILSVYWFNPVLWMAYVLLCKDIELACDEKVVRQLGTEIKKPYSEALINCSAPRKMISVCPLAFGENNVEERIKGVLNFKKPAVWIVVTAVIACIITAICLLTDPVRKDSGLNGNNYSVDKYYYSDVISVDKANRLSVNERFAVSEDLNLYHFSDDSWFYSGILKIQSDTKEIEKLIKGQLPLYYQAIGFYKIYATEDCSDVIAIMSNGDIIRVVISCYQNPQQRKILSTSKLEYDSDFDIKNIECEETNYLYVYLTENDSAYFSIVPDTKKCSFSLSRFSSYFGHGAYEENDNYIIMKTDDDKNTYTFRKQGSDLIFVANKSSEVPSFKYSENAEEKVCIPDGAVFKFSGQ